MTLDTQTPGLPAAERAPTEGSAFESLGLSPALLRALAESNYTTPTPIQIEAIPLAMAGHDLLGFAACAGEQGVGLGLGLLAVGGCLTHGFVGPLLGGCCPLLGLLNQSTRLRGGVRVIVGCLLGEPLLLHRKSPPCFGHLAIGSSS